MSITLTEPSVQDVTSAPCTERRDLFLHDLLSEPPGSRTPAAARREYAELLQRARAGCAACPLLVDCLYRAVVEVDVDGYVGCTTSQERVRMRRMLGISLDNEDLDTAAGVRAEGRPLDHETIVATRNAYPHDSLESLARRLNCSLSTVKRHLRRARLEAERPASTPDSSSAPSVDDVLEVFDRVVDAR